MAADDTPRGAQVDAIDSFADALYDLLHERAQSIGVLDIALEVNDWHVDGELMFSTGPDMGFTLDARAAEVRYCELLPGAQEAWMDEHREGVAALDARDDEARRAVALELLDGLLAARRPLLRRGEASGG